MHHTLKRGLLYFLLRHCSCRNSIYCRMSCSWDPWLDTLLKFGLHCENERLVPCPLTPVFDWLYRACGWAAESTDHQCFGHCCFGWSSNSLWHRIFWFCAQTSMEGHPPTQRKGKSTLEILVYCCPLRTCKVNLLICVSIYIFYFLNRVWPFS